MFRAILFDFDGTIADTLPIAFEAFRLAVKHHRGETLADAEIRSKFGPTEVGVMQVLVPEAPAESLDNYYRHYDELHGTLTDPFDGLPQLLDELRRMSVKLGIVTGKAERSLLISLRYIGLEGAFDELEAGCDEGPCKPDGIRRILDKWQMAPSQALYVGDSIQDIRSARDVGLPIASVSWSDPPSHTSLAAAGPDYIFSTVAEFRKWLLAVESRNG